MDESTFRRTTIALQIVSLFVLIVGGVFALWRYYDFTENDFKRPFWEKQIELYVQASGAASTLATAERGTNWDKARATFWKLYYGPLSIVEDEPVERAMVKFGKKLKEFEAGNGPRSKLQNESLSLSHTIRESIGRDWKTKLGELKGKYNITRN